MGLLNNKKQNNKEIERKVDDEKSVLKKNQKNPLT